MGDARSEFRDDSSVIRRLSRERSPRKDNAMAARPQRRKWPQLNHTALAVLAVVGVAGVAFGAVQVFGDPSAAGPRRA